MTVAAIVQSPGLATRTGSVIREWQDSLRSTPINYSTYYSNMSKFILTPQAAMHILATAHSANAEGMFLRVTGRLDETGAVLHGMGFDELRSDDLQIETQGVRIVMTRAQEKLLDGVILDYVKLGTGHTRFVFVNPNDDGCVNSLGSCGYCNVQCRPAISYPSAAMAGDSKSSVTPDTTPQVAVHDNTVFA
jgi:iron-sulfur cluster assembly protein